MVPHTSVMTKKLSLWWWLEMMFTLNNCPIKSSSSSWLFIRLNLNGRIDGSLQPTQSGLLTGAAYPYPVGRSLWWILSAGLILMSEVGCELFFCSPWIASEVIMRFFALLFLLFARKTKDNKNILIIYSTAYLHYKNIIENPRRRDKKRVAIVESKIKRKPDQDNNGQPKHGAIRKDIMSSVDAK